MNLKERYPESNASLPDGNEQNSKHDWTWVKGVASLSSGEDSLVDYNLYGIHHVSTGIYRLFGMPDGKRVDIRNIPRLWGDEDAAANVTREIILAELEKELKIQQDNLYLLNVKPDGELPYPVLQSRPAARQLT